MRLRDKIISVVCVILAVFLLIAAGTQLDYINSQRQEMKLISNEPLKNAPPSLAFATVAMGAFRGLVSDVLWIRADKLKEQGQFFDAKQLAEWITTLQPRFSAVWAFQAWNMAYNISVAIPPSQPEQRWQWVKNGYELLRDRGIPLNPKSILLYRELGNIFQDKIGSIRDDDHKYYKLQLVLAMEPLLGPADEPYFKALAETPADLQQITTDANIVSFINALKSADKAFVNESDFVNNYLSLRQKPDRFTPEASKVIDNFRGTAVFKKFDIFAKAYYLRNTWKLDPVLMQQINNNYGPVDFGDPNKHQPLDWRHPDAHAIYWAIKGLQVAGGNKKFSADQANTDRVVVHSLQNLFRYGKIFIADVQPREIEASSLQTPLTTTKGQTPTKEVFLRPEMRMFEPYNKAVMDTIEKYRLYEGYHSGTYLSMQDGHRNMLQNALLAFYQAGHVQQAQKIYEQLRQLYPRDEFKVTFVEFIKNRFRDELRSMSIYDAREVIQMMLQESYFRYAMRDDDEAFGREKIAKEVYDYYQASSGDEYRVSLPEFKLMKYLALMDFFYDEQYPPDLKNGLLGRIKVERPELYEQLKQQADQFEQQQQQQQQEQSEQSQ
jgi:hypothetical protein